MRRWLIISFAVCALAATGAPADQLIPVVNGTVGLRQFTTTVQVRNPTATEASCEFEYRRTVRPADSLFARQLIPARKTLVLEHFLADVAIASAVRVRCSSGAIEIASSLHDRSQNGSIQDWVFRSFGYARNPLSRSASFPAITSFVLAEVEGKPIEVALSLKGRTDASAVEKTYVLAAYGLRIIDLTDVLLASNEPTVELRLVSGDGGFAVGPQASGLTVASIDRRDAAQQRRGSAQPPDVRSSISELMSFKAAPFREPATGLVYMRDRWYDPATGTFLTPDRVGYRDSSNRFAFASGDPVNRSDPTGLYQADFHFAMTAFLARAACLKPEVAVRIAHYAEAPDQDRTRSPVTNAIMGTAGLERKKEVLREWHFPKPELTIGEVVPGSPYARRRVDAGLAARNIQMFGEGLHPFQDSWSHRGTPSLRGFAGHPASRGGMASTATDVPWRFPAEALAAAEETFKYMQAFATANPTLKMPNPSPCRSWSSVSTEAAEFIALKERDAKRRWLAARGIQMPEHYWQDVDMGPAEFEAYRKKLQEKQGKY